MPYLSGKTEEVSRALLLRHWAVPYDVIALIFGKDAMYWERLEESLGRMSIVGSLVKKKEIPVHLAWDEKISFHNGKEVYIGLNSSQDCILGQTANAGRIVFDRRYFWFKGGIRSI